MRATEDVRALRRKLQKMYWQATSIEDAMRQAIQELQRLVQEWAKARGMGNVGLEASWEGGRWLSGRLQQLVLRVDGYKIYVCIDSYWYDYDEKRAVAYLKSIRFIRMRSGGEEKVTPFFQGR